MRLIYRNGLFVPEKTWRKFSSRASNAETVFLQLVDAYNDDGRSINTSPTGNYAPSVFAKDKRD